MIINGLSTGYTFPDQVISTGEKAQLEEEIRIQQQTLQKEQAQEEKKQKESTPENELNDYYLKELLFLMTARGSAETIEKLAKLLKQEKEMLSRVK